MVFNKRGQLAIAVIIAIVIVGVILVVFLVPGANIFASGDVNPSSFLIDCIEPEIERSLEIVSSQGGYLQPTNYVSYKDQEIQYLCYIENNFEPCIIQQPLLLNHIEKEIESSIQGRARECVNLLESEYESRGFDVQTTPGQVNVEIKHGSVDVEFDSEMVVSREDSQRFERFAISLESEIYDLILTATSILSFESTLGDAETLSYVQFYPNLRIEKIERNEGDTIYILSNVVTGESFTFASRSLVFPSGYGIGGSL